MVRPSGDNIGSVADDQMEVIVHDGIGKDVDAKSRGERFESSTDPFTTEGIVLTGMGIDTGEEGSSDATLDDMHDADFVVYELARPSGSGHGEASSSAVGLEQTLDHQSTLMSTAHKRTSKSMPARGGDDLTIRKKPPIRRSSESHHALMVCPSYRKQKCHTA
jgi:hypothetical protein